MKLKVLSVDFEENLITLVVPKKVMNDIVWRLGDECEVDLTTQIKRGYDKDITWDDETKTCYVNNKVTELKHHACDRWIIEEFKKPNLTKDEQ